MKEIDPKLTPFIRQWSLAEFCKILEGCSMNVAESARKVGVPSTTIEAKIKRKFFKFFCDKYPERFSPKPIKTRRGVKRNKTAYGEMTYFTVTCMTPGCNNKIRVPILVGDPRPKGFRKRCHKCSISAAHYGSGQLNSYKSYTSARY